MVGYHGKYTQIHFLLRQGKNCLQVNYAELFLAVVSYSMDSCLTSWERALSLSLQRWMRILISLSCPPAMLAYHEARIVELPLLCLHIKKIVTPQKPTD